MKTKIVSITTLLLLVICMVSCDEVVTRDPSPETNPTSNKVYFAAQDNKVTLAISTDSFNVKIARKIYANALTVNLTYSATNAGMFTGPKTVTFPAGDSTAIITIKVGAVELVKQYLFSISIADADQLDPYTVSTNYPSIALSVMKEDFKPYADGTFTSEFFEDSWPLVLEYSQATTTYRLSDCWMPGYHLTFKWTGDTIVTAIGGQYKPKSTIYKPAIQSGYVHPTYGMVWAVLNGVNTYNLTTKTFTFPITWRVSAGSFGLATETFKITNLIQD